MKTNELYSIAADNGIRVLEFPLPECGSLSLETAAGAVIGIDSTHDFTAGEYNAHLGHELGHCRYGGFYNRYSPFDLVERHEHRADKWFILQAIPKEVLFRQLRRGYDAWEIAEQLDTTEEYVRMAYYYYRENA